MKDPWPLVIGAVAVAYLVMQNNTANDAVEAQALALQKSEESNEYLTVPGAVSSGLSGLGSIVSGLTNLFGGSSGDDASDIDSGTYWA
jgi:hypothetical protein